MSGRHDTEVDLNQLNVDNQNDNRLSFDYRFKVGQMGESPLILNQEHGDGYTLFNGDNIDVSAGIPDESIGFTVFSPPFESLYTYSPSPRDMGNCRDSAQFGEHFSYLIDELYRVTMPGRLISIHCMNLPTKKSRDGFIGLRDFRGDIIRLMEGAGFIFHSEVVIWKDPVTAMQRTKALGLLHKTICKDSSMSRMAIPDTVVTFRKPGTNEDPIAGPFYEWFGDGYMATDDMERYVDALNAGEEPNIKDYDVRQSIDIWQRVASPVWMDVDMGDTLQFRSARANGDERHVCALQIPVIQRCMQLWSNPGDVVLDPFNGIGSTGHVAIEMNRKYIGIELKDSYYNASITNLRNTAGSRQQSLFDLGACAA